MQTFDVVGVGIACMDYNITVTSIPKVDENVMVTEYRKQMGGTVSTALATFQRLGMKTKYFGILGGDEHGRFTLEGMRAEGIDVGSVRLVEGESSPFSFVLVDSMNGRRSIAYYPGCSLTVGAECIEPGVIEVARMLHVDISTPAVFAACEAAKRSGVTISVEANAPYPGLDELLASGDIFITSQEIMTQLSGQPGAVAAGKKVKEEYDLDLVVVTCGAAGSIAIGTDEIVESPGFPVRVVDTTGAGDVYHGAFLYAYLMGWGFEKALRFANAAAAIMCTGQNGWADIPTLQQVEDFLAAQENT
jgi:sugar/nucleoside kinase (ribokinase family)